MEHMTKHDIFTRHTGTPIDLAASRKPPVARIQLPKFEPPSIAPAKRATTANQINDTRSIPAGPTNWVKIPIGSSLESSGGNPPVRTTVSERTMNNMPSVAMKLGILKTKVMKPLAKPTTAEIASPSSIAGTKDTPWFVITATQTGMRANIDPTERSNSPQIISKDTPIETSP